MTNSPPDRLDRMESLLQETIQITRSNAKAVEANSAAIAANRADLAATNQKFDALLLTIAESNARSEARLNRLDDAIAGISATNERLYHLMEQLVRRNSK